MRVDNAASLGKSIACSSCRRRPVCDRRTRVESGRMTCEPHDRPGADAIVTRNRAFRPRASSASHAITIKATAMHTGYLCPPTVKSARFVACVALFASMTSAATGRNRLTERSPSRCLADASRAQPLCTSYGDPRSTAGRMLRRPLIRASRTSAFVDVLQREPLATCR